MLLLLSRFSRVQLCATPEKDAHQPPPSLGFSRQEHWSGLPFSNEWKWKVKGKSLSCVRLPVTPWTTAHQAPPSMGFSRQEYWSGMPLSSPFYPNTEWNFSLLWISVYDINIIPAEVKFCFWQAQKSWAGRNGGYHLCCCYQRHRRHLSVILPR